jgi:hypothetical protein
LSLQTIRRRPGFNSPLESLFFFLLVVVGDWVVVDVARLGIPPVLFCKDGDMGDEKIKGERHIYVIVILCVLFIVCDVD